MPQIPEAILQAIRCDEDTAFVELMSNEQCVFWVDWRADEEEVVADCEAILQTRKLTSTRSDDGEELDIFYGSTQLGVPFIGTTGDRHLALLTLNKAMEGEYEVRMLYASEGLDGVGMVPLSCDAWRRLEQEASEIICRRFHVLSEHPNIFTETVKVPKKPGSKPWWRFW